MQAPDRDSNPAQRDFTYAVAMAIACLVAYVVTTRGLHPFVERDNDLLGGMWAAVATIFVFRETTQATLSAGTARLIATCVSFALCLLYLSIFSFTPVGMVILLAIGTVTMTMLDRRGDIITTGITTTVVIVAAAISPQDAWLQPLLRLVDTVIGIAIGVACRWIATSLFDRLIGEPTR